MKRYLTIKEVANELEYSQRAVRNMIKQDAIPHIRIKKQRIRIPRSWLDQMLKLYPTEKEYSEAKEDIKLSAELPEPKAEIKEVKEEMPRKTEPINTEITTNKPKPKAFIPNPKKRAKKAEPDPEPEENEIEEEPEEEEEDILSDYKGIGNYD